MDSPLENVTFDNVRLTVDGDPESPLRKGPTALTVENARNLRLKDVDIMWGALAPDQWQSALVVENVAGLTLDGVSARQSPTAPDAPAVVLRGVSDVLMRDCRAQADTGTFLRLEGAATREVVLPDNDTRHARAPVERAAEVDAAAVPQEG